MKVKINQKIMGVDGLTPLPNPDKSTGKILIELTLKDVCINSLLSPVQGEDRKKKIAKYEVYEKLRDAKIEVELTIEDLALIKECNGIFQPQLLLGQCDRMLEK